MSEREQKLLVHWQWAEGTKHAGTTFWSCHSAERDGRLADWPNEGFIPLAAVAVDAPAVGQGLDLIERTAARTRAARAQQAPPQLGLPL